MSNPFQKATLRKAKLRLAITGPTGSGKTYTAISIASGLGGKISLIDTEAGAAHWYANLFDYDTVYCDKPTVDNIINFIHIAERENYDVIIIDSLTHAWKELLDSVNKLANAKYRGNSFQAWSEGTPVQNKLISAIQNSRCHIIATIRSKMDYSIDKIDNKTVITKVGLSPDQRNDVEYEFDGLLDMSIDHIGHFTKDRSNLFQDLYIEKPGPEIGRKYIEYFNSGTEEIKPYNIEESEEFQYNRLLNTFKEYKVSREKVNEVLRNVESKNISQGNVIDLLNKLPGESLSQKVDTIIESIEHLS